MVKFEGVVVDGSVLVFPGDGVVDGLTAYVAWRVVVRALLFEGGA